MEFINPEWIGKIKEITADRKKRDISILGAVVLIAVLYGTFLIIPNFKSGSPP